MSASVNWRFTEDNLLDDYRLVSESIRTIGGGLVMYLTPKELDDLREGLLEEIRKDRVATPEEEGVILSAGRIVLCVINIDKQIVRLPCKLHKHVVIVGW